MKKHKIVHINSIYLNATFIYYLINNLNKNIHYFLVKEIKKDQLVKFPFKRVIDISKFFYPLWLINKFLYVKFGFMFMRIPFTQILAIRKINNIDLLHAHFGNEGYYTLPLAKFLNVPLIVTFYGGDMSDIAKKLGWMKRYKKLFKEVSIICVEGEFMKRKMVELGCPLEKVIVSRLPIPIDNIEFSYRPNYSNTLNVLMCARMVKKKGYFDALATINKLKEDGIKIKCEIIGNGKLQDQIIKMINNLGLNNEVKLLGRKTPIEIYEISNKHHVFFHPSKFDSNGGSEGGAPTIISQMQALGLPIISTTHADIPNVIPIENHFLAEEGNTEQLVDYFKKLISCQEKWNEISNRGMKFVQKKHNALDIANKMEELYNKVIINNLNN